MKWNEQFTPHNLFKEITNYDQKLIVAKKISEMVVDNECIGFGSGSTAYLAIIEIAKRIKKENLSIIAIPTSLEIRMVCGQLGIPTATLLEQQPDWCFDGADEVDPNNNLIKGRGGAMFQEKLIIKNAKKAYILIDKSKYVKRLGEKFKVPVEVYPQALSSVIKELTDLNATDITLRTSNGKDGPVITENGNFIVDVTFAKIEKDYEQRIKAITGVIESGLFIGYNIEVLSSND